MLSSQIPSYEDLKSEKNEKHYSLWFPPFGGYFRIVRNEDDENNISLDYLESGYLSGIVGKYKSNYKFNKLYKFNKKNYEGLVSLYKQVLIRTKNELDEILN